MGYEHKILVVQKSNMIFNDEDKRWAEVVAIFNFCKYPMFEKVFKKKSDCYFYFDENENRITKDLYGGVLTEASVQNVIDFLEKEKKYNSDYRRLNPLLGLLKGFDESEWKNLTVLHYGY